MVALASLAASLPLLPPFADDDDDADATGFSILGSRTVGSVAISGKSGSGA